MQTERTKRTPNEIGRILYLVLLVGGIVCAFARALFGPKHWGGAFDGALMLPLAIGLLSEVLLGRSSIGQRQTSPCPFCLVASFSWRAAASSSLLHGVSGINEMVVAASRRLNSLVACLLSRFCKIEHSLLVCAGANIIRCRMPVLVSLPVPEPDYTEKRQRNAHPSPNRGRPFHAHPESKRNDRCHEAHPIWQFHRTT